MTRHIHRRLLAATLAAALCMVASSSARVAGQGDQKPKPGQSTAGQGKKGGKQTGVNPGAGQQQGGATASAVKLIPRIKRLKTPLGVENGHPTIHPLQNLTIEGVNFSTVESKNKVILRNWDAMTSPYWNMTGPGPTFTLKPTTASPTMLVVKIPPEVETRWYEVSVEVEGHGRSAEFPGGMVVKPLDLRFGEINLKAIEPKHAHRGASVTLRGFFPASPKVVFEPYDSTYEGAALTQPSIVIAPTSSNRDEINIKLPDDLKVNGYRVSVASADFSRRTNRRGFTLTSVVDGPLHVSLDNFNCAEESDDGPGSDEILIAYIICVPDGTTFFKCHSSKAGGFSVDKGDVVTVGRQLFYGDGAVSALDLDKSFLFVGVVEMDANSLNRSNEELGDPVSRATTNIPKHLRGESLRQKVAESLSAALTYNKENDVLGVQELVIKPDETEYALNEGPVTKYLYFSGHEAKYRVTFKVSK